jgi:hypothetical protein
LKLRAYNRLIGTIFILILLLPLFLILPSKDSHTFETNYQSGSTFHDLDNQIEVTRPVTSFNNATMTLAISGVVAQLDGVTYNGTTHKPDSARFSIYREINNEFIRNGILSDADGDGRWTNTSINLARLKAGSYYVISSFTDNSATGTSPTSNRFFVLGNLTVSTANLKYLGGMTQKLNITEITVNNQSSVDVATYTLFDYNLKANTSISGNLVFNGTLWNAYNVDVSRISEGSYCVLGYFQDISANRSGIGNPSDIGLKTFTVDHILTITYLSQNYIADTLQIVAVEIHASTSYQGAGVGAPIRNDPNAKVLCTIVNNATRQLTQIKGYANWVASSSAWKVNLSTTSFTENLFYMMVNFSVTSNLYNASAILNSTSFLVKHVLTLIVPRPQFNPNTAKVDIVGIVAINTYSGYHHINSTTVLSTYFEIFNSSKISIGIHGALTYNPTFDDWRNTSIDLSAYKEGLYYIYVKISSIDVPEGAVANSTSFELVHKLIISGINLNYNAGFTQTLNITVLNPVSTYKYPSSITHANYRFYFQSNHTAVNNQTLGGNLTWTGSVWYALANVSKLPAMGYYVMVNFADATAANSKGSAETTNFTIVHSLSVNVPQINYINNMKQFLNISCSVSSSFYSQRFFNSSNFGTGTYRIYLNNGTATTITGSLGWNGTYWVAKNADVSLLPVGTYRLKCSFSASYATVESTLSNSFIVSHAIEIAQPTITLHNNTKQLDILHVKARSSFFSHGYLTNLTATNSYFEIFHISNQSTGIHGQLSWNGTEWQIRNFAVPSLTDGQYYIKLYFNDSQTSLTEISSTVFAADFPESAIDWVVVAIILLIAIAVVVVLFWTFFSETPEKRSEAIKKEE